LNYFIADNWRIETGLDHFDWFVKTLKLKFDEVDVGQWDNFILCKTKSRNSVTKGYRKTAGLTVKKNKTW